MTFSIYNLPIIYNMTNNPEITSAAIFKKIGLIGLQRDVKCTETCFRLKMFSPLQPYMYTDRYMHCI